MPINLSKYSYQGKWFPFKDGSELLIRPFPQSLKNVNWGRTGMVLSGDDSLKMFDYCLQGWKAVDEKGNPRVFITLNNEPVECNAEAKKIVFDFDVEGISGFVMEKIREFDAAAGASSGN